MSSDEHTKYFVKALGYKGKYTYGHIAIGVSSTMSMGGSVWTFRPGSEKLFVESLNGPVWWTVGSMYEPRPGETGSDRVRLSRTPVALPVSARSIADAQNALALDCEFRERNMLLPRDLKKK